MSTCSCEQCSATPAPTWTEAHRHDCEVRSVAKMPRYQQRVYLVGYKGTSTQRPIKGIRHHRGLAAVKRILKDMRALRGTPPTAPAGQPAEPRNGP